MKKIGLLLLSGLMVIGLMACGGEKETPKEEVTVPTNTEQTENTDSAVNKAYAEQVELVLKSVEVITKRLEEKIKQYDGKKLTPEEEAKLTNEVINELLEEMMNQAKNQKK